MTTADHFLKASDDTMGPGLLGLCVTVPARTFTQMNATEYVTRIAREYMGCAMIGG